MRPGAIFFVVCSVLVLADAAYGQAAQVTTGVGPHYAGEEISIRVTAVGFEEDPPPIVEVPAPAGGRLEFVGVSPSVSQSITIVNGRMSRTREVTHVFQFRFVADGQGNVKLGPFRISQGQREASIPVVRLKIHDTPSNDDVRVALTLPPGDRFVGERVPVTISFTLERSLQQNLLGYTLRVPLFDEQSMFRFLDDEDATGDTKVVIDTGTRQLELPGTSREHTENQKRYTTVSVTRTLVPLAPGSHRIPGVSLSVEEGVRFRRDFFGGRRATQVRRWRADDPGQVLEVAAIPGRQQPPSFGGGIGRGFTLEVTADRTVVQVGDPITLTFVLHGQGLETASLPALDAEGLLPADRFRVPSATPTGELQGDAKRFTAVVRVLAEEVAEIPALAYSWFDPDAKRYETTHSRPIALSVRSAEVIGAGDVQVGEETLVVARSLADESPEPLGSSASLRPRSLALTGADLAIERDFALVLGSGASWSGRWLAPSLYAGSLFALGLAVLDRRRRQVDPERARRKRVLAQELDRIRGAGALPAAAGAAQIAQAIRRMLQEVPEASKPELDLILGQCDARSYAPAGAEPDASGELVGRALELAEAILEVSR